MEPIDPQEAMTQIEAMTQQIVQQFHPLKIILFGSYARGSFTLDSDVDLLVVMEVSGSKRHKAAEIDLALAERTLPLDLIVVTPQEYERYRNVMGHIICPAVREGKVLYERAA